MLGQYLKSYKLHFVFFGYILFFLVTVCCFLPNCPTFSSFIASVGIDNSSDGRVIRASASGAVDLGLIPSRVKPMALQLVFTASLLDALH